MNLLSFKSKSLIYISEDIESITKYKKSFDALFSNVIYTKTYTSIIEEYFNNIEKSTPIDLILFDLNKNSLSLLKEIRQKNQRIPIVLISSDYSDICAFELVNLKTAYCFKKEADEKLLIKEFFSCIEHVEKRILSAYLDLVAIVTRLDLTHKYIYVNDMFIKTSAYKKEELLGKNESLLTKKDPSDKFYQDIYAHLEKGKNWSGILKKYNKNQEEYYVNASIFPIFNSKKQIREYLSIEFLVTEDIEKISKLKKYIILQKSKSLHTAQEIDIKIQEKLSIISQDEKIKIAELTILIQELEFELKKTQKEKREKSVKYSHLESVLRNLKNKEQDYFIQSKVTIRKLAEVNRLASVEKTEVDKKTKFVYEKLINAQHNIETLQGYIEDYRKKIENLEDVIASNEKDLAYLKIN